LPSRPRRPRAPHLKSKFLAASSQTEMPWNSVLNCNREY
jgi:hypothetical protein